MKEYTFLDTDIREAILLIGLHGPDLIGMELGVFRATSTCTILQQCPNVKKLYGIDSWKPYTDYISPITHTYTKAEMETHEFFARHHIKWSGEADRAELIKGNTNTLHSKFDDETFDFIFFDAWCSYEQVKSELHNWYPKIKKGGLVIGHDYSAEMVSIGIAEFREEHNITSHMATYNDTFVFKK